MKFIEKAKRFVRKHNHELVLITSCALSAGLVALMYESRKDPDAEWDLEYFREYYRDYAKVEMPGHRQLQIHTRAPIIKADALEQFKEYLDTCEDEDMFKILVTRFVKED